MLLLEGPEAGIDGTGSGIHRASSSKRRNNKVIYKHYTNVPQDTQSQNDNPVSKTVVLQFP